jgi:hypothetical protein
MINTLPNQVNDSSEFRHAWNKLIDYLRGERLQSSSDILVNKTTNGKTLTLANEVGSSNLKPFEIHVCVNGVDKTLVIPGAYFK